ncbi:unnamed protein product [Rangifer tarandus platyrhynchus]|uniref:Uncharacterized protein n=1 Tax=Rangifer tarandus platyrhynchus TaxID=3082113 RepID=A0ABN8ZUY7_RANTA|nr:unnamed protein product [Rangifer tarandus platyrhynchus]
MVRVGLPLALGWESGKPLGGQARTICEAGRPHCTYLVFHVRVWARMGPQESFADDPEGQETQRASCLEKWRCDIRSRHGPTAPEWQK